MPVQRGLRARGDTSTIARRARGRRMMGVIGLRLEYQRRQRCFSGAGYGGVIRGNGPVEWFLANLGGGNRHHLCAGLVVGRDSIPKRLIGVIACGVEIGHFQRETSAFATTPVFGRMPRRKIHPPCELRSVVD
jgi:hypothetical protein